MSDEKVKYQGAVYHNRPSTALLKCSLNAEQISRQAYTHAGATTSEEYHDKRSGHLQPSSSNNNTKKQDKNIKKSAILPERALCGPEQLWGQGGEGGDSSSARIFS
ncbi:hypothetical protein CRENBAI_019378 [Crenichthys baileyi]|uniref:Uncharacterized protein n=1 Tax=Crenichthys baileyi TaxID=28760 RepID=A0AAV9RA20_9TELE